MYNVLTATISEAGKGAAYGAAAGGAIDYCFSLAILDTIASRVNNNDVSLEFREVMPLMLFAAATSPYVGAFLGGTAGAIVGAGKGLYHSMTQSPGEAANGQHRENNRPRN